jgi:hypothetical protein
VVYLYINATVTLEDTNMAKNSNRAPGALSVWFIIHFVADLTFAIPMMIIPVKFMQMLGWVTVDPIATRIVAAALFGIGIESLIGRNSSLETFKGMLNLKIIWSLSSVVGIGVSMIGMVIRQDPTVPLFGWVFLGIFIAFNFIWSYWRIRVGKLLKEA